LANKRRGGFSSSSRLTFGLGLGESELQEHFAKSLVQVRINATDDDKAPTLVKSILNVLNGPGQTIERLAFETDPSQRNNFAGVYRAKLRLIPDQILQRIAIQDSLVSNIVRARQNHVSSFGRPRPDRFSTGFEIKPETGVADKMDEQEKKELGVQIKRAVKLLSTCGNTQGLPDVHQSTFAEYLSLSARDAVTVGRLATEVIWIDDPEGGFDERGQPKKKFHHFVHTDAGTVYKATTDHSGQDSVRRDAYHLLCQLTGKKLEEERYNAGEYCWVQVISGQPKQVFTGSEMKCYNFYAVGDVALDGYPVTPIDTVISAVTTHINITTHNRLYFQSGRASRGMLIIKSDDASPTVIHNVKQQFNASINSVSNAWRMPVFGCGTDEEIAWQPIDTGGGRDMEFQYLTDMNAREILTAFMMSPDELPGWSYLSRGTNNQALSESNNEYKLQAARDVGIRPLLLSFEDFINNHLFPLIDPDLAKKAKVKLVGLEVDNAEKEAVRTQQDMGIWMTYDDVLERVEKKPLGRKWAGAIPLNPVIKSYWDQYFMVGEILAEHCDRPEARNDPSLQYRRDPFFFQWVQLQQAQQQAQLAAQQGQPPGGGGPPPQGGGDDGGPPKSSGGGSDDGGDTGGGSHSFPAQTEKQKTAASADASASPSSDLARSIDVALDSLAKSEHQLPPHKRRLIAQQRATVEQVMRGFLEDTNDAVKVILGVADHHKPR
jgi:hypothetical protein